jgi:hypothetical protein
MSNKYFTPIEFPELDKPVEVTPVIEKDDELHGDLKRAFVEVRRIFAAIRTGQSNLRRGALDLKDSNPCMLAFSTLEKLPTKQNLIKFLLMSKQDIGLLATKELLKVFLVIDKSLEEKLNVKL